MLLIGAAMGLGMDGRRDGRVFADLKFWGCKKSNCAYWSRDAYYLCEPLKVIGPILNGTRCLFVQFKRKVLLIGSGQRD